MLTRDGSEGLGSSPIGFAQEENLLKVQDVKKQGNNVRAWSDGLMKYKIDRW